MTISKCLPEDGSPGVLPLYEALDPSLLRWKYRGLFHDRTGEVVNFFQLQDRWVLLRSPFCDIEYETGQFDMNELRFNPCTAGKLAYGYIRQNNPTSRGLYASDVYSSPDDRRILVGWISGFPEGRGWNGCMSLPRVLTIDTAGRLCQHPLPELSRLRGTPHVMEDRVVENGDWSPARTFSPSIEISLKLRIDTARQAGLRLRNRGQKEGGLELSCDRDGIQFNSLRIPVDRPGSSPFDLRLFVDRLVVEAFINQGSLNVTQCIPLNGEELEIEFFARGGAALLNGTVWPMKSIWQDGTGRLGAG